MNLAKYIDHTILKAETTTEQVEKIAKEAVEHSFFSVCVNSSYVPLVRSLVEGSTVRITSVIGFPLGAMSTAAKVAETKDAIAAGADEIDMVIHLGMLKDGRYDAVREDIRQVKEACGNRLLKVIIESAALTDEEIVRACKLSEEAGADFVKTSTGFHAAGGASEAAVALMRRTVGDRLGVKASGGIRDYDTAVRMVQSGATRLGASASVDIVRGRAADTDY
ncbi:MAG: deoxyribose-phosphate aldolase [Bacillota bacterium]|nr:deoxyribose-phosphate aldolase [Bacillota bacterium]